MRKTLRSIVVLALFVLMPGVLLAQQQSEAQVIQTAIEDASRALTIAENVGAPVYAQDLYNEALARLNVAKQTAQDKSRSVREKARLLAVEARYAARAAEAKSRWLVNTAEARNLREDIGRFGGTLQTITVVEDVIDLPRGITSMDRVNFAQAWLDRASAAGGTLVAPDEMKNAKAWLESARRIARSDRQNDSADHLAYAAEMMARRAFYQALRQDVDRFLPALRLERTRLSQVATEQAAISERQRREQAERETEEMRRRLASEAAARRAQQHELDVLRSQLSDREQSLRSQLEADRTARLEAEQRLYELVAKYESALSRSDQTEIEVMRREVEDQRLQLGSLQERQRLSEQSMTAEMRRLQQELERERVSGRESSQALAEREAELTRRQQELQRLQDEREASMRRSSETESRLNEATQRVQQAELESERLRTQMQEAEERARQAAQQSQQIQVELERVRADRDRLERIRLLESSGATVRTETRGIVVTLPGGIFFDSGKATLKPGARNILVKAAGNIKDMPNVRISIEGHTDNVGSDEMNMELSQKRAEAVRDLLVSEGVDSSRISATGRGEAIPIVSNNTESGRQQNRRVELIISQ